ncbi:Flp family type IVb pilin [Aliiruegeria lutimaris]|uniref:Pilus assembly protein Flp/PilA n=1 Tax=Aliiruegeria lutimaris TaxID=571298 RepID=A0A1G9JXI1_9RHOB|nr:hypothetical protein [Aliiruegeria lutimaris]SDL42249.1 hypothetical protein SAMN04488026_108425 [Aliiruegeria lutimaris]
MNYMMMRDYLRITLRRYIKDDRGVTLVEYGVALTLAVGLGAAALSTLSTDVGLKMGEASGALAPQ